VGDVSTRDTDGKFFYVDELSVLGDIVPMCEKRFHVLLDRYAHVPPCLLNRPSVAKASGPGVAIREVAVVLRLLSTTVSKVK
jgi:hypothetical protein